MKVKLNYSETCKSHLYQKEQGGTEGIMHNAHGLIRYNCTCPLRQWWGNTVHMWNEWEWVCTHVRAYVINVHQCYQSCTWVDCVRKHLQTDLRTPYVYFFISYLLPLSFAIASDLCMAQEMWRTGSSTSAALWPYKRCLRSSCTLYCTWCHIHHNSI